MIIFIGFLLNQPLCLVISLLFLLIAAIETAIGLSLIFLYYKTFGFTSLKFLTLLRF